LTNVVAVRWVSLLVRELLVDVVELGSNYFNFIVSLNIVMAAVVKELLAIFFVAFVVVFLLLSIHSRTSLAALLSVEPVVCSIGYLLFVLFAAANNFLLSAHSLPRADDL